MVSGTGQHRRSGSLAVLGADPERRSRRCERCQALGGAAPPRAPEIGPKAGRADLPLVPNHPRSGLSEPWSSRRTTVGYRGSAWWEGARAPFRVLLGPARRLLSARASGGLSPHERPSPIQWPLSAGPFVQEAATSCRTEKGAGGRKPKCGGQPCLVLSWGLGSVRSPVGWMGEPEFLLLEKR